MLLKPTDYEIVNKIVSEYESTPSLNIETGELFKMPPNPLEVIDSYNKLISHYESRLDSEDDEEIVELLDNTLSRIVKCRNKLQMEYYKCTY